MAKLQLQQLWLWRAECHSQKSSALIPSKARQIPQRWTTLSRLEKRPTGWVFCLHRLLTSLYERIFTFLKRLQIPFGTISCHIYRQGFHRFMRCVMVQWQPYATVRSCCCIRLQRSYQSYLWRASAHLILEPQKLVSTWAVWSILIIIYSYASDFLIKNFLWTRLILSKVWLYRFKERCTL